MSPQPDVQSAKPVILPPVGAVNSVAVQVNVVPVTKEVGVYPIAVLLQIVLVAALLTDGMGFTVITTFFVAPIHPRGLIGVTTYVAV